MSQVGEIITVNGRPAKVVERDLVTNYGPIDPISGQHVRKPFSFYAVRVVPVDELGREIESEEQNNG